MTARRGCQRDIDVAVLDTGLLQGARVHRAEHLDGDHRAARADDGRRPASTRASAPSTSTLTIVTAGSPLAPGIVQGAGPHLEGGGDHLLEVGLERRAGLDRPVGLGWGEVEGRPARAIADGELLDRDAPAGPVEAQVGAQHLDDGGDGLVRDGGGVGTAGHRDEAVEAGVGADVEEDAGPAAKDPHHRGGQRRLEPLPPHLAEGTGDLVGAVVSVHRDLGGAGAVARQAHLGWWNDRAARASAERATR